MRYYLITYPRTASNLVVKILNLDSQPDVSTGEFNAGYFFHAADEMFRKGVKGDALKTCYQDCFHRMKIWLDSQTGSVFVKEHSTFLATPDERLRHISGEPMGEGNCTVLPDEFLQTWSPTFLIRHPALSFPSYCRVVMEGLGEEASANDYAAFKMISLKWSRRLYDMYREWGISPIVIDAEDVISSPEMIRRYCELLQMDPEKLRFEWDAVKGEEWDRLDDESKKMRSTLYRSSGVEKSKARDVDMREEVGKWKEEFGEEAAKCIERMVEEAMSDYEYLRGMRLRCDEA